MCLIKSLTAAAMLIVFISKIAYATNCDRQGNAGDPAEMETLYQMLNLLLEEATENLSPQQSQGNPGHRYRHVLEDVENNDNEYRHDYSAKCCQYLRTYGAIFHNFNVSIAALRALNTHMGEHASLFTSFVNRHRAIGDQLGYGHGEYGEDTAQGLRDETDNEQLYRVQQTFKKIKNALSKDHAAISECQQGDRRKRLVGFLSGIDQPKMEARNAPLPAESAAGRWEYVARENRAFQQQPDRLEGVSVDPLDDMARQIRVYDKLKEIRRALKRSDELLVYPMGNDDMREVRAYDQPARPRLVSKRNEFLTNTWVGGDAPDTYYLAAKRDAEALGPFAESGKRSMRLDATDQALQLLDLFSKK